MNNAKQTPQYTITPAFGIRSDTFREKHHNICAWVQTVLSSVNDCGHCWAAEGKSVQPKWIMCVQATGHLKGAKGWKCTAVVSLDLLLNLGWRESSFYLPTHNGAGVLKFRPTLSDQSLLEFHGQENGFELFSWNTRIKWLTVEKVREFLLHRLLTPVSPRL